MVICLVVAEIIKPVFTAMLFPKAEEPPPEPPPKPRAVIKPHRVQRSGETREEFHRRTSPLGILR
jgi:hypothetical protein